MRRFPLALAIALLVGCSAEAWKMTPEQAQMLGDSMGCLAANGRCPTPAPAVPPPRTSVRSTAVANQKIMVFGGRNHTEYLGCLSCDEYASDSIHNVSSPYGSQFSPTSIVNAQSDYGSRYSTFGACNPNAADPPVIVDAGGTYYGKLTLNQFADPTRNSGAISWLQAVCATH